MLAGLEALGGVAKGLAALVPFVALFFLGRYSQRSADETKRAQIIVRQRDEAAHRKRDPDDLLGGL